ncbi:MAG: 50S ribosomal protein L11 methyltransferase [Clostridia bacterium]|nr:50S ribosomal protein L11 methyltransferase [Clostridia bacterium]
MKWQEVVVTTSNEAMEAVSNFFHEVGAGGVVVQDPLILQQYAASGQWDCHNIPQEQFEVKHVVVKGYLPVNPELPHRLERLKAYMTVLKADLPQCHLEVALNQVAEEDWANSWKIYYKPIKISAKLVVVPSWEEYCPAAGEEIITLDPGMAFGTGTHDTTQLCVRLLEKTLQGGETVVDVGTGSGILSLAAAKLGARVVLATDIDRTAVEIAEKNMILNQVDDRVTVRQGNLLEPVAEETIPDVIVANIAADVILLLAPDAYHHLQPGGSFITSGIINNRQEEVSAALVEVGFKLEDMVANQEWAAILAKK